MPTQYHPLDLFPRSPPMITQINISNRTKSRVQFRRLGSLRRQGLLRRGRRGVYRREIKAGDEVPRLSHLAHGNRGSSPGPSGRHGGVRRAPAPRIRRRAPDGLCREGAWERGERTHTHTHTHTACTLSIQMEGILCTGIKNLKIFIYCRVSVVGWKITIEMFISIYL